MMFKRKGQALELCVLQVSTLVMPLPGTVISDQNAASDYVRFLHPRQWQLLDFDAIYAMDWRHPTDQIAQWRHSSQKLRGGAGAGARRDEVLDRCLRRR